MFDKMEDDFAKARGDEVGCVAEEDGTLGVGADRRVKEFG